MDKSRHHSILEAHHVSVTYGKSHQVLNGVSVQIYPGVVTMVLGKSGSGKTTLLRVLAGIVSPSAGTIEKSLLDAGVQEPHIAYIPQSLGLVRTMTALENTLMGALKDVPRIPSLLKIFPEAKVKQAHILLTELGLSSKINQQVFRLSGGESQRVAIARALMQNPQIILADEFVSQLDAVTTYEILKMTRRLTKQGITFLITTHDVDLVKEYADRVIIMGQGKMLLDSPTQCLMPQEMISYFT